VCGATRTLKIYHRKLEYFEKLTRIPLIKMFPPSLSPLLAVVLLTTPAMAWFWHVSTDPTPSVSGPPAMTQRLPVEIITSDTPPKWVLIPIAPR
jgi:hypothetical protein